MDLNLTKYVMKHVSSLTKQTLKLIANAHITDTNHHRGTGTSYVCYLH
jgi:hypothetical protein